VHRDIKPENILLQGGHALVADFGIALAVQHAGGSRLTQTGLSLGTPQYMAPEQAMGEKGVDARADLYALGAVTYEMLVGEPPFTGATVQAIVAKVISSDPEPPTTMRKTIPEHVEAAVLTALAKLPADRQATVSAFAAALGGTTSGAGDARVISGARRAASNAGRVRAWAMVGGTIGVFAGFALAWLGLRGNATRTASGVVTRNYVTQPANEAMPGGTTDFVLSPDGDVMVYVGPGEQPGGWQLWRKRRADLHAERLAGTAGGYAPFFSPDGKWVAFFTAAGLSKVAVAGGSPILIGAGMIGAEGRGAWLDNGRIAAQSRTDTYLVADDGSSREVLAKNSQFIGYNPTITVPLPGSRGVLVQACPVACSRSTIFAVDIATKAVHVVVDGRDPLYLPTGHLGYIAPSGGFVVAPFDVRTMKLTGNPIPIAERVSAPFVTASGTLMYREAEVGEAFRAVWVDRAGRVVPLDTSWLARISSFDLSPDGKRMAVSVVADNDQHMFLKDLPNGPLAKFSSGALNHFRPVWSADGSLVRFIQGDRTFRAVEKNANGSGDLREIPALGHQVVELITSRDGAWMVLRTGGADTSRTLLVRRLGVDSLPRPLNSGSGNKLGLTISPDSRFIAYVSGLSGRPEVYVSPFPDMASARWQVSLAGGHEARWSADGKSLFYVNMADELTEAKLTVGATISVASTAKVLEVRGYERDGGFHQYLPDASGQRFLMMKREQFPGTLVIVDNWVTELRATLSAKK
jgi:Tol biopolymer transport system component